VGNGRKFAGHKKGEEASRKLGLFGANPQLRKKKKTLSFWEK
jgi:hypothetical protein